MRLIITATDFSDVAKNAAHYACKLAADMDARVVLLHSFSFPVMFSDVPMPTNMIDDVEMDSEEQIKVMVAELQKSHPAIDIHGLVIDGNIIDALEKYTKENEEPWLIVLGNSMASEHASSIDSIVVSAFKNLKYPVLAVPPGLAYAPVKKMCLAFDNRHEGNTIALTQLSDIAIQLNADLEVLNLQEDVLNRDNTTDLDEGAINILAPAKPRFHIIYEVENIEATLQDFAEKNNTDWLVMIPRKYSFFEGLFHRSHTTAMAHNRNIPILALHETKAN